MRIHELKVIANRRPRRAGRGISAGRGKTAGRGTKGQNARTGGGVRPGFEGGQNPLTARLPKLPGFPSRRPRSQTVTLGEIARVKPKTVTADELKELGLIADKYRPVRVVLSGELASAKSVRLQGASKSAAGAIEKSGGSFTRVPVLNRAKRRSEAEKPLKT